MFLIPSMLTQLPGSGLRIIVLRTSLYVPQSARRHWSTLIRSEYRTELHPGLPIPEPLRFCFALCPSP
jgi:hypothetical protein